ncbi:MAG: histidine kinase dimerization/phospho-acceptor domain-containing protein, partial [Marinobacter sp.]|nr:histidine kinase dimerization/phospho-acceptor domain-containing protein [Marinobacter sp.]
MMPESTQRPVSLQQRLGVGLTILLASLWLAATGIAGFVVRSEMYEVFDSALQETAERLMPLAVMEILNQDTSNGSINPQNIASLEEAKEYLTYTVRDASGHVLLQSHEAKGDIFPANPVTGFHNAGQYRFYGTSAISHTLFIEVAEPLEHRRKALLETVLALLVPLALAIPLSFLGVWYYVRRSLRPMVAYRDAIEARGEGDLTPVDSQGQLPAEMEPVSRAVNSLMERLERALEAERSFTSNSAHELRTPIAEALAQTQRLKRELADGLPSDERIKRIESSLRKLSRLSEKLMQLARAEGAGLLLLEPADLTPVLHYVLQDFRG